nr:MAG TPA: hypothetical protein [Bacteriophage sp.]
MCTIKKSGNETPITLPLHLNLISFALQRMFKYYHFNWGD